MATLKLLVDCTTGEGAVVEMTPDEEEAHRALQDAAAQEEAAQAAATQVAQEDAAAQRAADLATLQAAVAGTPLADPQVLAAFGRLVSGT